MLELIPLGINGFFPSHDRQTMSFLLLTEKEALVLDAGTGIARLLEEDIRRRLEQYDSLNIILSHYHLDHFVGLSYLPGLWSKKVKVYAPSEPFIGTDPKCAINKLLNPPLYSLTLDTLPMPFEVIPMTKPNITVGEVNIMIWAQKHPGGSIGIRIGDDLAYVTDTIVDFDNVEKIRNVHLLMHEVWMTDAEADLDPAERGKHSYLSGVAG